jgi:hypothetical protein
MSTAEGLAVWVVIALVLWLAIAPPLQYVVRVKGAGIAAAILSWLIARAAMFMMSLVLHWLRSHPLA